MKLFEQICERFQLGFPYSWEELATQLCGEESANRGSPRGKLGFDEPEVSSGITAKAASVSFDDLPVTRIRDILMHPLGDSKDCVLADMLEQSCSNDVKLSPISTNPDSKNPVTMAKTVVDETPRTCKRKAGQKYKDGGKIPRTVDTVMGECITPSRGIVTRSMSRLRNLTEIREETPLSNDTASCKAFRNDPDKVLLCSSIKSKDNNFPSTSEVTKSQSRVMRGTSAGKDSCSTISRLMDDRKMKEKNLSSNSTVTCKAFRNFPEKVLLHASIKSKDNAFLSTSEATKNGSRGMISTRARKGSWATTSSEKVMEAPVVSSVRRSSRRCNIRKDYRVK
ncbi:unnamed protein product [Dovyalis caffra]|uniref:SANTA domain-containing protein n=1 Tax=Dovyalis caffra TaxID=77055 RepID=A0AAV1QQQ6_9ROSI|nr:unnamed protein product [Dovyalis caffra]